MNALGMAAILLHVKHELDHGLHGALDKAGALCVERAKAAIGTYEYGWPPLSSETVAHKGADTPLLETGALRESISHTVVSGHECWFGTNDEKAEWLELGTPKMPPRSFIAETGRRSEAEIVSIISHAVHAFLP